MAVNKSRDRNLDAYLAVVPVTTAALQLMPVQDPLVGLARASFLVGSDGVPIGSGGTIQTGASSTGSFGAATSFTRPSNTTDYAAGDVVGATTAALSFTLAAGASQVMITSASLEIDIAAVGAGMTSFNLALYSVTPPSALADNAAWDLPSGDRASFLGLFSLGTPVDLGSTIYVETNGINKQITAAGANVFGYLITVGAWTTPTSAAVGKVTLHTLVV